MTESWIEYLFGFAEQAAKKAKPTTKVGAVLVSNEGSVLLTGFNGPPRNVVDTPERLDGEDRYLYCAHAEQNIIATAAKYGVRTKGMHMYTTHFPCSRCAQMIIAAGITGVIYGVKGTRMPENEFHAAEVMFAEASIDVMAVHEAKDLLNDADREAHIDDSDDIPY